MLNATLTRIIAGPGTGKTTSLMNIIRDLLVDGANPEKILLVTFTRTSALDLKKELERLNVKGADKIHSGTLHSFCLQILFGASVFNFTGRTPRVLSDYETRFLLEDLRQQELGKIRSLEKQLQAFEAMWAREQDDKLGALSQSDKAFEQALGDWLRFHRGMLLSEIIPETLKFLRANPASPTLTRFEHVLVDEYQDLNRAEQSLIDLIADGATLTIVGDEDQSIYQGFRYAHPEGISQFHVTHPGTKDQDLSVCRRCPTNIVDIANSLISFNKHRTSRSLTPSPTKGSGEIHVVQWEDMESEAQGLASFIESRCKLGKLDLGQVLILCPRRQFGYKVKEALNSRGIAAHSFFQEELLDGQPKKLDECPEQEAFALLKLAQNSYDRVSLRCWLGFGHNDLRSVQYDRVRDYCYKEGLEPFEVLRQHVNGSVKIVARIEGVVDRFKKLQEKLQEFEGKTSVEIFDLIFPASESWAEPFREIVGTPDPSQNLDQIISDLQLAISQPEMPTDVDYVRIMSLHKSKGLSAEHVIVMGFIQGLIPGLPDDDLSDLERDRFAEEQRRLFYVALTRTKVSLVLSGVASLPTSIAHQMRAMVVSSNRTTAKTMTSYFYNELGDRIPTPVKGTKWKY